MFLAKMKRYLEGVINVNDVNANKPTGSTPPIPPAPPAPAVKEKPLPEQVRDAIKDTRDLLNRLNVLERKVMQPREK